MQQIDERYDKEYGAHPADRGCNRTPEQHWNALNARYNEERRAAAQEYAETLSSIVMPVWNQPEIQQASQQVDELFTKLREYSMAGRKREARAAGGSAGAVGQYGRGVSLTEYLSADDADSVPAGQRHERSRSTGAVPGHRLFGAAGSVCGHRQLPRSHQDRPARTCTACSAKRCPKRFSRSPPTST